MSHPIDTNVSWSAPSMGGTLKVAVATPALEADMATLAARRTAGRVNAWADRLTRFDPGSDLSVLNCDRSSRPRVRPTLAAALRWSAVAHERTAGVVDATMLDARLAAEQGGDLHASSQAPAWSIEPSGRSAVISRPPGLRFDLDGIAKGWLADRALELLRAWPGALVDTDGDIALSVAPGVSWTIEVDDPSGGADAPLATLQFSASSGCAAAYGVATSGTSVHRWTVDDKPSHHLIDPCTGRPAQTDIVQVTVIAPSAREAEVLAKAAVIVGSPRAFSFLAPTSCLAAVMLLESGEVLATEGIDQWLA